jgi:hypothetical protein
LTLELKHAVSRINNTHSSYKHVSVFENRGGFPHVLAQRPSPFKSTCHKKKNEAYDINMLSVCHPLIAFEPVDRFS